MRNISETVKMLSINSDLDYTDIFDEVKSILEYCDRNIKPFKKLKYRAGNEVVINELTRRMQMLLAEHKLITIDQDEKPNISEENHAMLRKITLFLFANTDASYKYNLRNDTKFAHIFEVCPLLPKFLLVTLMWELNMDVIFIEVLSYTPFWFSYQYFETASESMKYIDDPYVVLNRVEKLVQAACLTMARSKLQTMEDVDRKIIYGKLYDYTMNFLRQFYTPDSGKFQSFTGKQLLRYGGYVIKHLLNISLFAFDLYKLENDEVPETNTQIYEICCQGPGENKSISDGTVKIVKEMELKIINALLNALQTNVMLVTIDSFMEWIEVDLTPSETLQSKIGEMAHAVCEHIKSNKCLRHDVISQLQHIAIRPKAFEECLKDATLGDILRNLEECTDQKRKEAWFDELIRRPIALGNDECLQTIKENINLLKPRHVEKILSFMKLEINWQLNENQISDEEETEDDVASFDFEELTTLVLDAMKTYSADERLALLLFQKKSFGINSSICRQSDFPNKVTEFFNKSSGSELDYNKFLLLCFESPEEMWSKFFELGCHSKDHGETFCSFVKRAQPFSGLYCENSLIEVSRDHEKWNLKNFSNFMCNIYYSVYHPQRQHEFMEIFFYKNLDNALEAKNFRILRIFMKTLNMIVDKTPGYLIFGEETTKVLIAAATILDKSRWDIINFNNDRLDIVSACIEFVENICKIFLPVATIADRGNIQASVNENAEFRLLTKYYFQKFTIPENPSKALDRFLVPEDIKNKTHGQESLLVHFVRCTSKESEQLASGRFLSHISNMMIIFGVLLNGMQNPNTNAIYFHCVANYVSIIRKYILPQIQENSGKIIKLIIKLFKIIENSPVDVYENVFLSLHGLLVELMKMVKSPLQDNDLKSIEKHLIKMKDCNAKKCFLYEFQTFLRESD